MTRQIIRMKIGFNATNFWTWHNFPNKSNRFLKNYGKKFRWISNVAQAVKVTFGVQNEIAFLSYENVWEFDEKELEMFHNQWNFTDLLKPYSDVSILFLLILEVCVLKKHSLSKPTE